MEILKLFSSSKENELIISTVNSVLKYDLKGGKVLGKVDIEPGSDIRQVQLFKDKVALCGKNVIHVTNEELELICTIQEKFSIKSAFW